jgi:hypothetical protein
LAPRSGQRRRVIRNAVYQHVSRHPAGISDEARFHSSQERPYYLMVRPDIKDLQQLKGKRIGVATIKGTDQLVAEEMLQAKGFNPNFLQAVAIGDGPVRMQALISGAVEAICVAPPHDLMLKKMGYPALAGPPEVGLPSGRNADVRSADQGESFVG